VFLSHVQGRLESHRMYNKLVAFQIRTVGRVYTPVSTAPVVLPKPKEETDNKHTITPLLELGCSN